MASQAFQFLSGTVFSFHAATSLPADHSTTVYPFDFIAFGEFNKENLRHSIMHKEKITRSRFVYRCCYVSYLFFNPTSSQVKRLVSKVSGDAERPVAVRMLLPHEILSALQGADCPFVFESIMLGNLQERDRIAFWSHLKSLPPWASHPVLNSEGYNPKHLVGFTIHADGAQMYRDDEYFVWSLSSVFAASGMVQDVLAFQFPIAIVPERMMRSKNVP